MAAQKFIPALGYDFLSEYDALNQTKMAAQKFIPALGYDFLSEYYDIAIRMTMPEKKFRSRLMDFLNPRPAENILEFGFGTAQNLILLKQRCPQAKAHGVDIDPKIKSITEYKLRKNNLDAPLHLYDGFTLPFADNSFDKIFSSLVFHQLDADTKSRCLNELQRVLKSNGNLLIGDWGGAKNMWMRYSFYVVQLLDGFKTTNDNVQGLMPEFMIKAGFKNTHEIDFINTAIGTYSYYAATKTENT